MTDDNNTIKITLEIDKNTEIEKFLDAIQGAKINVGTKTTYALERKERKLDFIEGTKYKIRETDVEAETERLHEETKNGTMEFSDKLQMLNINSDAYNKIIAIMHHPRYIEGERDRRHELSEQLSFCQSDKEYAQRLIDRYNKEMMPLDDAIQERLKIEERVASNDPTLENIHSEKFTLKQKEPAICRQGYLHAMAIYKRTQSDFYKKIADAFATVLYILRKWDKTITMPVFDESKTAAYNPKELPELMRKELKENKYFMSFLANSDEEVDLFDAWLGIKTNKEQIIIPNIPFILPEGVKPFDNTYQGIETTIDTVEKRFDNYINELMLAGADNEEKKIPDDPKIFEKVIERFTQDVNKNKDK